VTLVISALTQNCVWQVADRRLTDLRTRQPVAVDTNKAIHFAQSMLFAYTGPAQLEDQPTAEWIADQLWQSDPEEGLIALEAGLNRAIPKVRRRDLRSFAVDGVGWGYEAGTGRLAPRLLRLSNCLDDDGIWTGVQRDRILTWDGLIKPSAGLNMRAAGQPVPMEIGRYWERQIRRRIEIGAPPSDIGRCLVQFVRDVAKQNSTVGRGVLISAIPREAVIARTGFTVADMPRDGEATFKYFPEGALDGVDKGPEIANPGGSRMADFYARTDADGSQVVQVSFKVPPHVEKAHGPPGVSG